MSTFVLVHGIAHGAWCWERTRRDLEGLGHRVVAVDLPLTSLDDDAAAVAGVLDRIAAPVVLVGHSYGGLVISKAAQGRKDVRHLVYVAAIMIDADDVFIARSAEFAPTPLSERTTILDDGSIVISPEVAAACFYNTCQPADAADAAARMRPTALACLAVPTGAEPWRHIPSTYVLCERDMAIDPQLQGWMAKRATRTVRLDTDHSPFLSKPRELLEVLLTAGSPGPQA